MEEKFCESCGNEFDNDEFIQVLVGGETCTYHKDIDCLSAAAEACPIEEAMYLCAGCLDELNIAQTNDTLALSGGSFCHNDITCLVTYLTRGEHK